jgi:hypothetical protein
MLAETRLRLSAGDNEEEEFYKEKLAEFYDAHKEAHNELESVFERYPINENQIHSESFYSPNNSEQSIHLENDNEEHSVHDSNREPSFQNDIVDSNNTHSVHSNDNGDQSIHNSNIEQSIHNFDNEEHSVHDSNREPSFHEDNIENNEEQKETSLEKSKEENVLNLHELKIETEEDSMNETFGPVVIKTPILEDQNDFDDIIGKPATKKVFDKDVDLISFGDEKSIEARAKELNELFEQAMKKHIDFSHKELDNFIEAVPNITQEEANEVIELTNEHNELTRICLKAI